MCESLVPYALLRTIRSMIILLYVKRSQSWNKATTSGEYKLNQVLDQRSYIEETTGRYLTRGVTQRRQLAGT